MLIEYKIASIEMADAIYDLIHQLEHDLPFDSFKQQLSEKIINNDYQIYVAIENSVVIAFGELHFTQFIYEDVLRARLTSFCVDRNNRNKNIGTDFLRFLESCCKEKDCKSLELTSNVRRTDAHRFYEHCGFMEYSKMYIKQLP
jgi:GNAT superfamily N-acetyltransferase